MHVDCIDRKDEVIFSSGFLADKQQLKRAGLGETLHFCCKNNRLLVHRERSPYVIFRKTMTFPVSKIFRVLGEFKHAFGCT